MRLINYSAGYFSGSVFLLLGEQEPTLYLNGSKSVIKDKQYKAYLDALQATILYDTDLTGLSNYNLYTIDLQNFADIFMKIDDKFVNILAKFSSLIQSLVDLGLDNYANYDNGVQSTTYGVISKRASMAYQVTIPNGFSAKAFFNDNGLVSTRLINIAVPKAYGSVFYRQCNEPLQPTSKMRNALTIAMPSVVYNTSDFQYTTKSIGAKYKIVKIPALRISVTTSVFGQSKLLLHNIDYSNIHVLEQYAYITEDDSYIYIEFFVESNRTYTVHTNSDVNTIPTIPAGSIKITSSDMLEHARLLGLLAYENYMLSADQSGLVSMPTVTDNAFIENISISYWQTNDLSYIDSKSMLKYTDANRGNWCYLTYLNNKLQSDSLLWSIDKQLSTSMRLQDDCFNYFLLNKNASVAKYMTYAKDDCTINLLSTGLSNALSGLDLPVIEQRHVTFRNVTYTLLNDKHNNKRFAVVLEHNENANIPVLSLISDANFACLRIQYNLGLLSNRISVLYDGSAYSKLSYDVSKPATESHSGNIGIENTFDGIARKDFYDKGITDLLLSNIMQYDIASIQIDLSEKTKFELDLPVTF